MLHLARAVLALRRDSAALHRGGSSCSTTRPTASWPTSAATATTAARVGQLRRRAVALPDGWVVELATADAADGLAPDAATVLRPA